MKGMEQGIKDAKILYDNAKFYAQTNDFTNALVSYSCAAVALEWILRALTDTDCKLTVQNILNCCLSNVESLQSKIGSSGGSKKEKDEESMKCAQPVEFSGKDCLFFSDVIGLLTAKTIIVNGLINPLIYPNLYPKLSKGILIFGPPGTGKTYLVKAAVSELQIRNENTGITYFAPSPGDLKGKYVGETEKNIEQVFKCASAAACAYEKNCPGKKFVAVIFMDEFDAIAPDRATDTTGMAVNSVNTLLQMMDGISSKPNVAIVAATNYPWNLDAAILRRFDTQILIDVPTENDIQQLMDMKMLNMIDLDKSTENNFCSKEAEKAEKAEKAAENDGSFNFLGNCKSQCSPRAKTGRMKLNEPPYDRMKYDYFDPVNKQAVAGLINKLYAAKFSNSDIDRFFKAAETHASSYAVKECMFYSSMMLGDLNRDARYISKITPLKTTDESERVKNCIDLLIELLGIEMTEEELNANKIKADALKSQSKSLAPAERKTFIGVNRVKMETLIQTISSLETAIAARKSRLNNVYFVSIPSLLRVEFDGFWYYNMVALLHLPKSFTMQHGKIEDVYLKFHKTTVELKSENLESLIKQYRSNILAATDVHYMITMKVSLTNEDEKDKFTQRTMIYPTPKGLLQTYKPLHALYHEFELLKEGYFSDKKEDHDDQGNAQHFYDSLDDDHDLIKLCDLFSAPDQLKKPSTDGIVNCDYPKEKVLKVIREAYLDESLTLTNRSNLSRLLYENNLSGVKPLVGVHDYEPWLSSEIQNRDQIFDSQQFFWDASWTGTVYYDAKTEAFPNEQISGTVHLAKDHGKEEYIIIGDFTIYKIPGAKAGKGTKSVKGAPPFFVSQKVYDVLYNKVPYLLPLDYYELYMLQDEIKKQREVNTILMTMYPNISIRAGLSNDDLDILSTACKEFGLRITAGESRIAELKCMVMLLAHNFLKLLLDYESKTEYQPWKIISEKTSEKFQIVEKKIFIVSHCTFPLTWNSKWTGITGTFLKLANLLWTGIKGIFHPIDSGKRLYKSFFSDSTTETPKTEAEIEQEMTSAKLLNKGDTQLSIVFRDIIAYGFLVDDDDRGHTKSDNLLSKAKQVSWHSVSLFLKSWKDSILDLLNIGAAAATYYLPILSGLQSFFSTYVLGIFTSIPGIFTSIPSLLANPADFLANLFNLPSSLSYSTLLSSLGENIMVALGSLSGSLSAVTGYLSSLVVTGVSSTIGLAVVSVYLIQDIIQTVIECFKDPNRTERIIGNYFTEYLFKQLMIGTISIGKFDGDPTSAFATAMSEKIRETMWMFSPKYFKWKFSHLNVNASACTTFPKLDGIPGMEGKLINLNIPMESFYFALAEVKSTYNKELGGDLISYYNDRDKFLTDKKKKEKK
jgi:SpoVK/Ycf46/Vps4 family AAA+-type ATPase